MDKTNSITVLKAIIKHSRIAVTHQSIIDELEQHPNFPSLLAISDALTTWHIDNVALRVTVDGLLKENMPLPCIACSKSNKFFLVSKITSQDILLTSGNSKTESISHTNFQKYFQPTFLFIEKNTASGEGNYKEKKTKEVFSKLRYYFIAVALFFIAGNLAFQNIELIEKGGPFFTLAFLIKSIGLVTSTLLLIQSIDANNPVIKRICSGTKTFNCGSILSSKAATAFGGITWSDIGFIYFTGSWLLLLTNINSNSVTSLLAMINLTCLPYTLYSIYYQSLIAKKWCPLCLIIQITLWLEFLNFLAFGKVPFNFSADTIFLGVTFFLIPSIMWAFLKPFFLRSAQVRQLKISLNKFKGNASIFDYILRKEREYPILDDKHSIIVGDKDAEKTLTIISSPFCTACAKAHLTLDQLIEHKAMSAIKFQFIFMPRKTTNEQDMLVINRLLALKSVLTGNELHYAIKDWYSQDHKDFKKWAMKYPIETQPIHFTEFEIQKKWCREINLSGTPTFLFNGRKIPEEYQHHDFRYILN